MVGSFYSFILPLNLQLFYKTQALKMHNAVNWIACMPCKTKLYSTKTVKSYLKTTHTILLTITFWFKWSHTSLGLSNPEIIASL